jgi:hypothetical protein
MAVYIYQDIDTLKLTARFIGNLCFDHGTGVFQLILIVVKPKTAKHLVNNLEYCKLLLRFLGLITIKCREMLLAL